MKIRSGTFDPKRCQRWVPFGDWTHGHFSFASCFVALRRVAGRLHPRLGEACGALEQWALSSEVRGAGGEAQNASPVSSEVKNVPRRVPLFLMNLNFEFFGVWLFGSKDPKSSLTSRLKGSFFVFATSRGGSNLAAATGFLEAYGLSPPGPSTRGRADLDGRLYM